MTVHVLGTPYAVLKKQYGEDPAFECRSICGYCSGLTKEIVICDMATYPGWEEETPACREEAERETLRHEIVHAFFNESGLKESACEVSGAWTRNEEMVDWLAVQGLKIYRAWQEAGAV